MHVATFVVSAAAILIDNEQYTINVNLHAIATQVYSIKLHIESCNIYMQICMLFKGDIVITVHDTVTVYVTEEKISHWDD